jgi:hypothetical protein
MSKARRSFLRTRTSRFVAQMFIKNTKNTVISIIIIVMVIIIIMIIVNNMCAYGMYVARKPKSKHFSLPQQSHEL